MSTALSALEPAPADSWQYPYDPTPKQQMLHQCRAEEILYGGAAGGGKTDALIAAGVTTCLMVPGCKVILFRRTYNEIEAEILPRMQKRIPEHVAHYSGRNYTFTFTNGAIFRLGHMQYDKDVTKYQGPEYVLILWDELTHFTRRMYTFMRSRLRMAGEVAEAMNKLGWKPRMISGTNPGGPGHGWTKRMFVDPSPGDAVVFEGGIEDEDDETEPITLAYIPAKATDNPHLDLRDYLRKLNALDPVLARAMRDGDWNILEGVRFVQFRTKTHVVEPEQLPISLVGYPRAVAVDYGFSAPFCALWGALLPDGLVVVYRELYKAGLTAEEQAQLILEAEQPGERIPGRPIPVALDPACWSRDGGGGMLAHKPIDKDAPAVGSIAWWYRKYLGSAVQRAVNDRIGGWGLVDQGLRVRGDSLPRLLIYSTCRNLIRTLPEQMRDNHNPEDVDTDGEDHAADTLRYLLQRLVGGGHNRTAPDTGTLSLRTSVAEARKRAMDVGLADQNSDHNLSSPAEIARRAAVRRQYTTGARAGVDY